MYQSVQLGQPLAIMEHERGQLAAIDAAIRIHDSRAKLADRAVVGFPSRLQNLMAQFIRLNHQAAQIRQRPAHKALPAGQASGKSHTQHGLRRALMPLGELHGVGH